MKWIAACVLVSIGAATSAADPDAPMRAARERWQRSPHGEMLTRIIPPYLEPSGLPEPGSLGARLTTRYCVQCHNLASPAMHDAGKWPAIVGRMLPRMRGHGNMGPVQSLLAAVPVMMVSDVLKGFVQGGGTLPAYMKAWGFGDSLMHGVSRAGLGGVSQLGVDALRDPVSLLGPTVEQITKLVLNPGDLLAEEGGGDLDGGCFAHAGGYAAMR